MPGDTMSDQTILVTGAAGFIGFHVARQLLAEGRNVVGLDNLNITMIRPETGATEHPARGFAFQFRAARSRGSQSIKSLFAKHRFPAVIHLAAQAGVRHSIDHPHAYVDANLEGFVNVLEGCRHMDAVIWCTRPHPRFTAPTRKLPFSVDDKTDHPVSLYAATKKANELMAHSYSHLYRLPVTGLAVLHHLRAMGPAGHGDFLFAKAIVEGTPIKLFNHGKMRRDFTYIDDVSVPYCACRSSPQGGWSGRLMRRREDLQCRQQHPEELMHVVALLEKELGRTRR
jgi:UDP-glucuronate 4-epimerase